MKSFSYQHRVTYADCTVGNHVYYGRYWDVLEAARGAFFREIGSPLLELECQGIIFPVIEAAAKYRGAARYDDFLTIETRVTSFSKLRLSFGYLILSANGQSLVEAETHHVCTNLENRPLRIPADLAESFAACCLAPTLD